MLQKYLIIFSFCLLWCLPGASAGASWYLAALNPAGSSSPQAAFSGMLPGENPAEAGYTISEHSALPAQPLWYDRQFPKIDPSLLRSSLASFEKRSALPQIAAACGPGMQKNFWVKDDNDLAWRQVAATCKKESEHGCIFVDDELSVPADAIELYGDEFDLMHDVVGTNIGAFADRDANGKVAILLYSVNDSGTTAGYLAGYFWNKDFLEQGFSGK